MKRNFGVAVESESPKSGGKGRSSGGGERGESIDLRRPEMAKGRARAWPGPGSRSGRLGARETPGCNPWKKDKRGKNDLIYPRKSRG